MITRTESGIRGLDVLMQGGIPTPAVICVVGDPGTGKTTFAMQSLFHSARKGEAGLYITGAESIPSLKRFMAQFSFYNEKLIEEGKIKFWDLAGLLTDFPEKGLGNTTAVLKEVKPKRVIVDPLPPFYLFDTIVEYRRFLYKFFTALKSLDLLAIVISEKTGGQVDAEYLADGVIHLTLRPLENPLVYRNLLQIKKMRGTHHTREILGVDMSEDGFSVVRIGRIM